MFEKDKERKGNEMTEGRRYVRSTSP